MSVVSSRATGALAPEVTARASGTRTFGLIATGLALAVSFLVLYPIARMLLSVFVGERAVGAVVTEIVAAPWLPGMLRDTALVVGGSGVAAIIIGSVLAWINERTDARLGLVGDVLPLMPFLLPAIAMAIGWVFLASPGAGFINGALRAVLQPLGLRVTVDIGTWSGAIFVYTIHAVPYVYLVVGAALRNVDPALDEAAQLAGAGPVRTFLTVSFPAVRPAIVSAALLVAIVGISNYSIAAIIAGRAHIDILSVRILRMLTFDFPPKFQEATVLSLCMFAVVLVIWLLQRRVTRHGLFATVGGKASRRTVVRLGGWRWPARALMIVYFACAAVLPMAALAIVSFQPFWQSRIDLHRLTLHNFQQVLFGLPAARLAFVNSFFLGVAGATILMVIAVAVSTYLLRSRTMMARLADGVTKIPATMSHVAIGVGFVAAFSGPPFNLAGTILILILVYIVIYLPEASIVATSSLAQVGSELIEASEVANASEWRTFRRVIVPVALPGLVAGWALLFVLVAGEVTASSMLAGIDRPVIGFEILQIWNSGVYGTLAATAGLFAFINLAVVAAAITLGRLRRREVVR